MNDDISSSILVLINKLITLAWVSTRSNCLIWCTANISLQKTCWGVSDIGLSNLLFKSHKWLDHRWSLLRVCFDRQLLTQSSNREENLVFRRCSMLGDLNCLLRIFGILPAPQFQSKAGHLRLAILEGPIVVRDYTHSLRLLWLELEFCHRDRAHFVIILPGNKVSMA